MNSTNILFALLPGMLLAMGACTPADIDVPVSEDVLESGEPLSPTPSAFPILEPASLPTLEGRIVLWLDWNSAEMQTLGRLITRFNDLHSDVNFEVVYIPAGELQNRFELEGSGPNAPTILLGPSVWGPELLSMGLIQDPSDLIPPTAVDPIHPLAMSQVEYESGLLGLPLAFQTILLYRNSELLERSSVSTGELASETRALERETGQEVVLDLGFLQSGAMVSACGEGPILPDGGYQMAPDIGLCWLEGLQTLAEGAQVVFNSAEDLEAFLEGSSPWILSSSEELIFVRESLGDDRLIIDPWPILLETDTNLTGYVWTDNAYIGAQASDADLEASIAFLLFLLLPESQITLAQADGVQHLPVVAQLSLTDSLMQSAWDTARSSVPLPLGEPLLTIAGPLETVIRLVVLQGGDPLLALQLAEIEILGTPEASPTTTP